MTVNRTTLLDLPLPVTGTESGTWGDTTNNGLSQYMDIAIAGMNSLTSANFTAGALTIANTQGDSSATNIAAGSAQYATIKVSSLAVNSTITAPGSNRSYRIINADATYSLTIKASGQTGVTFLPGQTGVVAFNGTDYVIVGVVGAGTATDNAVARFDGTTGEIIQNSVVTIADSTGDVAGVGALTMGGNLTLNGGTANGVLYLNGSKVATSGSALTYNGTALTSSASSAISGIFNRDTSSGATLQIQVVGNNVATLGSDTGGNGYFDLVAANSLLFRTASTAGQFQRFDVSGSEGMRLTSTGLGIGTSSPDFKLVVAGNADTRIRVDGSTSAGIYFTQSGSNAGTIRGTTSGLQLYVPSTGLAATLDSSGNLGLGVTPSTSGNAYRAFEGFYGTGVAFDANNPNTNIFANAYNNGTNWLYKLTGYGAGRYQASSGTHAWYNAPSGTAGNAITFTQAMTLDASGNLGIGTTSPSAKLHVVNQVYVKGTSGDGTIGIGINSGASAVTTSAHAIRTGGGAGNSLYIETQTANSNGQIIFSTNGTERARIDSSGNLLVGTTTDLAGNNAIGQFNQTTSSRGAVVAKNVTNTYDNIVSWNAATSGDNSFVGFYTETAITSRGSITYNRSGGLVAYNTTSDYRAKDIIGPVQNPGATIDALKVYEGKMKGATQSRPMLVAHEAQEHAPYAVTGEKDAVNDDGTPKFQQMDVSSLVPLLLAEIQSLRQRVALLEGTQP